MKPGYKLTEVGEMPQHWEVVRLQSACAEPISYGIVQCGPHVPDGVPYIRVSDMDARHLDGTRMLRTAPAIAAQFKRSTVRRGDIVYALRGVLGEVRPVPADLDGANLTQGTARLSPATSVDGAFFLWAMRSPAVLRQAEAEAKGTTFREITLTDLRRLMIALPPPQEQRQVASVLRDADALVESLEQLLAKKRAIKQGAMQSLLTGARRLPGFASAWEVAKLGRVAEITVGRTPPRSDEECWGPGFVWLTIADLRGKRVSESKEQVTPYAASSMQIVKEGTLMMSFKLSIGRLGFAGCDLFTNEAICSFTSLKANAEFLYHALSRTDFSLYGKQAVKGYTLNQESLRLIEVTLPSPSEQAAIAEALNDLDADIDATAAKLAKARAIKQGMMQELLTGRIRLA